MRQDEKGSGTPHIAALAKSLAMLEAVLCDVEVRSISAIAAELGLPRATAHRQVATLVAENYLTQLRNGRLAAGPRLFALLQMVDERQPVISAAAPILRRLAAKLKCVMQLGTLDNDMVTYRIKAGRKAGELFTKVGLQLEPYCTAIGKVMLAHLPEADLAAFLSSGPFPALTSRTITDPDELRRELDSVRINGYARDDEEIAEGLVCIAVPIHNSNGDVIAAVSASRSAARSVLPADETMIAHLRMAARDIQIAAQPQPAAHQ